MPIDRHKPSYRFLDDMLNLLSSASLDIPGERAKANPLAALAETMDASRREPVAALLRAWAVVGDVLTFYQQRIADEGALSTALEDRSAYWIARGVGYQPRPAVAASTWLAFAVNAAGGKQTIAVPKGTAVGNVPAPGSLPAIFETSDDLTADPVWNAVPCAIDDAPAPVKLAPMATRIVLEGTSPVVPGSALAIVPRGADPAGVIVAEATADRVRDTTLVRWQSSTPVAGREVVEVFTLDVRLRPFGALAAPFAAAPPSERRKTMLGGVALRAPDGTWTNLSGGIDVAPIAIAVAPQRVYGITPAQLLRYVPGEGWSVSAPFVGAPLRTIVATPDGRLAVGTETGGVFVSVDDGETWLAIGDGSSPAQDAKLGPHDVARLPAVPIRAVAIDESGDVPLVFVATDRGIASIALNGSAWTWRNDGFPGTDPKTGLASLAAMSLTISDEDGSLLTATTYGVFQSFRGERWVRVQGLGTVANVVSLPQSRLVAAGPGGVFRSSDGGVTWSRVTGVPGVARALAAGASIVAVAIGPDVSISDDGGETWTTNAGVVHSALAAVAVAHDGTVAVAAPLVENPSPDWPEIDTMIAGKRITLDREIAVASGEIIVLSRDDGKFAEAYRVTSSRVEMVAKFGMAALCTIVTVDRDVPPRLSHVRHVLVFAGARPRNAVRVSREGDAPPRSLLAVPRGLTPLPPKKSVIVEGRPPRVMLRAIKGGPLRIVAASGSAAAAADRFTRPGSDTGVRVDPDYDVDAAIRAGARGVAVARYDGVWQCDDVTDAAKAWVPLSAPIAVVALAARGDVLYACGTAAGAPEKGGVYAFEGGAWSPSPLLRVPVERLFVTPRDAAPESQTLWACGARGLYEHTARDGWRSADAPLDARVVLDVAADTSTVLAATDNGVYVRRGTVWSRDSGLGDRDVLSVAVGDDGTCYAGTSGNGVWLKPPGKDEWEPLLSAVQHSGEVTALCVLGERRVVAAERARGLSYGGELIGAALASNVRAFVRIAPASGAASDGELVLAFTGIPLAPGPSPTSDPAPMRRHPAATDAPMRRDPVAIDVDPAEADTLDAGMLPAAVRVRIEDIVKVKLDAAEIVVEQAGVAWRLRVSDVVPVLQLRRGPQRVDVFEVVPFELAAPPRPFGEDGREQEIDSEAVSAFRLSGYPERTLLARESDVWYAPAVRNAPPLPDASLRAEVAVVASHDSPNLMLTQPLAYAYDPRTVTICANVVEATHGAAIFPPLEVIASGDSSVSAQTARLANKPLTYLAAVDGPVPQLKVFHRATQAADPVEATASLARGGEFDGVRWTRVKDHADSDARAFHYVVSADPDGLATITFGDGEHGRRLPAGVDNVVAHYRVGAGPGGNVPPGALTLFQKPIAGADRVRNPVPAAGGAPADRVEDVRRNVVRGRVSVDRVVSQRDLEDFVLARPGVAKADVAPLPGPRRTKVPMSFVVTYANADGDAVDARALRAALIEAGTRGWFLDVKPYRARHFTVEARLYVDAGADGARVVDDAKKALLDAFSFTARALRQDVLASEIVKLLQNVRRVRAVALDRMHETGSIPRVVASIPGDDAEVSFGASLLTLGPDDVRLTPCPIAPEKRA